jgi:hypothetical protein
MNRREIFIGGTPLKVNEQEVQGEFVNVGSERFYRISNVDRMPDFFMSIVSASDHWMFLSSNGSLSAGRKNPEGALFPYYSEDKIHDYKGRTGSKTLILVRDGGQWKFWEPFEAEPAGAYLSRRNIYKNLLSNKVIFEEVNEDLKLSFRYSWCTSNRFGFVKGSELVNHSSLDREIEVLDGLQNILPSTVNSALQLSSSNLLDAYKRQELIPGTSIGIYRLSSVPTDAAEPSESLKATTLWSEGLPEAKILLSSLQLETFRNGAGLSQEEDIKATRGAYFAQSSVALEAGGKIGWNLVAEVNQDAADVAELEALLRSGKSASQLVQEDIDLSSNDLYALLASSDAMQCTQDDLSCSRHLSNVLFNVMRGGLFLDNYRIPVEDFLDHVAFANQGLLNLAEQMLRAEKSSLFYPALMERAGSEGNPQLERLCYEYLALTFSRRHGDPSRPWNKFSIDNRKADGSPNFDYQGNWRDIFQNWEALGLSFPGYVESMIAKFVNASTSDGYNPYRITRHGIDWEVPDPSDPWSNIGYWGDHQLIYLLKFLEISVEHHPGALQDLLTRELFTYANVPYRIRPYQDLLKDPHDTIDFDHKLEEQIQERVKSVGSDGKLVWDSQDQVLLVTLAEKLLNVLFSKLSNFIPGAGIWMNTQRPEWNDANNALVGYGVSMVTAYYLRAYLVFCQGLFAKLSGKSLSVSSEVFTFFEALDQALGDVLKNPETMLTEEGMKAGMDAFGEAGSAYRQGIYSHGFSGKKSDLEVDRLLDFLKGSLQSLDLSINSNRRQDGLYHAYYLIRAEGDQLKLRRLYEMLEGQVAILSSAKLAPQEAVDLLDALKASPLFREDQYSYVLYPYRDLPTFKELNLIPDKELKRSKLLSTLVERSDTRIVIKDVQGAFHFHGEFRNAGLLNKALDALPGEFLPLLEEEREIILGIYEKLFDHQSFTGRSGTFYGYEGLGSIYWHMVSKLLLAVCESYYRAAEAGATSEVLGRLAAHYYEIRAGIGLNKDPDVFGAFPTDPYSHTPGNKGAQQPGMTGQVKEDIIARWGELGVTVRQGCLAFYPVLLRREEFLKQTREFGFVDVKGERKSLSLEKGSLGFTYCQVPMIYHLSETNRITLHFRDSKVERLPGLVLDRESSQLIFQRTGEIVRVEVWLSPSL